MSDFLSFHLPETFVAEYEKREPEWSFPIGGGNYLSELIYVDKYAALREDGTKEKWYETCQRCIEGMYSILKDTCKRNRTPWNDMKATASAKDAYDRMFSFKWLPPGRGLQHMGRAIVHENGGDSSVLQNCSFVSTEKLSLHSVREATLPFSLMMEMSMLGVGTGFSVDGAGNLELQNPTGEPETFVVPDSREGWAESVVVQLESFLFKNRSPVEFDYSEVRPLGSPLKKFGGRASGPGPLRTMHDSIKLQLSDREGEELTSRDILDLMNKIGKAVQAGGSRRSAQISFGSPLDSDYINAKNWELPENAERTDPETGWSWNSNNSIFVEPDTELAPLVDSILVNGEPGFMWLDIARDYSRLIDPPDFKDHRVAGGNPCVSSDTWVMTIDGPRQVIDLIDNPVDLIYHGKAYASSGFWKTGTKQLFRLSFSDGRSIRVTDNHEILAVGGYGDFEWIPAGDLDIGAEVALQNHTSLAWRGKGTRDEGYVTGLFLGDGSFQGNSRAHLCVWEQDKGMEECKVEAERIVRGLGFGPTFKGWGGPFGNGWYRLSTNALTDLVESWGLVKGAKHITPFLEKDASSSFYEGFLRGLFDADGSVQGTQTKGVSVRLGQSNLEDIQAVQRMLSRLGINSTIYSRQAQRTAMLPDGRGGMAEYECKPSWDVVISKDNLQKFSERIGFTHGEKSKKLATLLGNYKRRPNTDSFTTHLISVEEDGFEDVYDVTVEDMHAFDANGITVHNCLEQSLEDKELCTLCETFPTKHDSFADFRETLKHAYLYGKAVTLLPTRWPESNEVMARNRRIGCSMSGLAEFVESRGWDQLRTWMDEGYNFIRHRDTKYSEWLAVRESIKTTSIKPSGCQKPETMVVSEDGIFHLSEMGDVDGGQWQILGKEVPNEYGELKKASQFYVNGFTPTKKITMKSGIELESTGNHQYRVLGNGGEWAWKRSDEIVEGDNIPYVIGSYLDIAKTSYVELMDVDKTYCNQAEIRFPSVIDEDLAWLLGLMVGDGSVHAKGIRVAGSIKHMDHLERAADIIEDKFKYTSKIYFRTSGPNNADLYFNSTWAIAWFRANGILKDKTGSISIPDKIRRSPSSVIESFLDGYCAADGHVNHLGRTFVTINREMAEEVVVILRALGHDASMREMPPTDTSFGSNMRYWIQEKKGRSGDWRKLPSRNSSDIRELDKLGLNKLMPDYVVRVEDSANLTLDIEVPEGNTYLANTYVSHNTVSILAGVTPGVHWPVASGQYIRRVRFSRGNPIVEALEAAGYQLEPAQGDPDNTMVATFVTYGADIRSEREVSIWEKAELAVVAQRYWADNQVSATITFQPEESSQLLPLLASKTGQFKGVSFLPLGDAATYPQQPYERIPEGQVLVSDYGRLDLYHMGAEASGDKFCDSDVCQI